VHRERRNALDCQNRSPRSRGIYFATSLAQNAGLRDKEIRTLQWSRLNLVNRMITVSETKSEAGTGRTIPMNEDLFTAAIEYAGWYTKKFGTAKADWFVFPFGKPVPRDPTRPQTTLKTAWRNVRAKAKVAGRWHDNRHTFVTDLAESGASDQMIQDLAGQVSSQMVKHYSHIRTEAKRRAVKALSGAKPAIASAETEALQNSETVPQVSPQVIVVN
jgi:integrase